jgi:hypothetical protein
MTLLADAFSEFRIKAIGDNDRIVLAHKILIVFPQANVQFPWSVASLAADSVPPKNWRPEMVQGARHRLGPVRMTKDALIRNGTSEMHVIHSISRGQVPSLRAGVPANRRLKQKPVALNQIGSSADA